MIDRQARRQYAQILRQFISGRMTNDEYEAKFDSIDLGLNRSDPAIWEVYLQIWTLYDDLSTHRMTGSHRLNRENRRIIARMVLFLQSDREYGWPPGDYWGCLAMSLVFADFWAAVWAVNQWPDFALLAVSVGAGTAVPLLSCWAALYILRKRRMSAAGDTNAWPFLRQAELEEAVRQPRLLNGKK